MHNSNIHNISSDNSNNQFMMESQYISNNINKNMSINQQQLQKMFAYMKNIVSNPLLMEQMEKHLASKQTQNNNYFNPKTNESLSVSRFQQESKIQPHTYLIEPTQQTIPQPLKQPIQGVNFKSPSNQIMKKGKDVLSNYPSKQNKNKESVQQKKFIEQKNSQSNQSLLKTQPPIIKKSFDEIPIKSNYINNMLNVNFQVENNYYDQQNLNNKKSTNKNVKAPNFIDKPNNFKKSNEFDERPINGSKKDFKQLLKDKFDQTPFDKYINQSQIPFQQKIITKNQQYFQQQDQENEQYVNQKPKKQFLKRGSRQYLSSAKDRVPKKQNKNNLKNNSNLNNSRLGLDRQNKQKDRTPNKRQVSQNRILSKRTNNNNDKSVSKVKNQSFYNENEEIQMNQKRNFNQKSIQQRNKNSNLPPKSLKNNANKTQQKINNKQNQKQKQNQKKKDSKNVFNDSSSQQQKQASIQQQSVRQNNFLKNQIKKNEKVYKPQLQYDMFSRQKKIQIIQGVFLSKTQLDMILQKYKPSINQSKIKTNDNKNQEKFIQLRKKYTDLCNLLEKQKQEFEQKMQKQRQQFQAYKVAQIQKVKNQKRVMERQMKSTMPSQSHNAQKDKQQVQNLKKQLEKQRQEHKKKDKNNKILIQKFKKQNQELKFRIDKLQQDLQKFQSAPLSSQNSFANLSNTQRHSNITRNNDKSVSKTGNSKDLSPLKSKNTKNINKTQQNEEDQESKNYKKTVLIKAPPKHMKNNSSLSVNKDKNYEQVQRENSDDENLPTFKIANNKNQTNQVKQTKKIYQYVQGSSNQNNASISKTSSNFVSNKSSVKQLGQNKANHKNVFGNRFDSQSENSEKEYQQYQSDSQNDQKNNNAFFKPPVKYQTLSDLVNNKFTIKQVTPKIIQKLFKYENNFQYRKYIERIQNPKRMIVNSSKNGVDKKVTNIFNDKSKQILFENGVKKQVFEDGYMIIYFKNGDIKQKLTDGTILYYFKEKQVEQITLTNGVNIFKFDNNQVQIHYDGDKYIQVRHPDGTIKLLGSPVH